MILCWIQKITKKEVQIVYKETTHTQNYTKTKYEFSCGQQLTLNFFTLTLVAAKIQLNNNFSFVAFNFYLSFKERDNNCCILQKEKKERERE